MVTAVRFSNGQEALFIDYSSAKYVRSAPKIAAVLKSLFRVVENGKFLKHLRNGHLEKSAVTGICSPSCSPTTAKTPAKVHLRLRFQNLGKPRTAGLCGRAAGACDCGPLSCTKIERPSPLEKPSCKVRLFVQNRSRKYRQKVTVTTLFQTAFHRIFQLLPQTAHICFHRRKWVHTRRNRWCFGWGWYHYPRSVPHVHKHPRAGCQNGKLCRFWVLAGCTLEGRRKPAEQRCAYARRCPAGVAAPLGCVIQRVRY